MKENENGNGNGNEKEGREGREGNEKEGREGRERREGNAGSGRMVYVANAFSLQMLKDTRCMLLIDEIDEETFRYVASQEETVSAVGHADTAAVLGVPCQRINVQLHDGDWLVVAQLQGGRLPEGATTLPEGFTFKYYVIKVM